MVTRAASLDADVVVDFDHNDLEFQQDEVENTRVLRARAPMLFTEHHGGYWFVSGYDEVVRISRDDAYFAHKHEEDAQDGVRYMGTMGIPRPPDHVGVAINEAEGPFHVALRRVLTPALSPKAVKAMEPFMEHVTSWFMDQIIESGETDLTVEFLTSVPAIITLHMLGLPFTKWREYVHLVHNTSAYPLGSAEYKMGTDAFPVLMAELEEVGAERRRNPRDPRTDLPTAIIQITADGEPMTDEHFARVMFNLLAGGIDTTASLTGLALVHLEKDRSLRQRLIDEPHLYPAACEEFLRFYSPAQTISRTARLGTVVGEQEVQQGDQFLISYLGANHDPAVFDRPEEIDLDRESNRHVAFGLGAHRCIGSNLARSEFNILLREVLTRMPDYRADLAKVQEYTGFASITGLISLPVTFTPGPKLGVSPVDPSMPDSAAHEGDHA